MATEYEGKRSMHPMFSPKLKIKSGDQFRINGGDINTCCGTDEGLIWYEDGESSYSADPADCELVQKTGIELITQERQEQIEKHGRTVEQDISFNTRGQIVYAVKQLIRPSDDRVGLEITLQSEGFTTPIGWDINIFSKMIAKSYKERLVIAGALIAAEIDRLNSLK